MPALDSLIWVQSAVKCCCDARVLADFVAFSGVDIGIFGLEAHQGAPNERGVSKNVVLQLL
ncbi:hypothetical protein [Bradyrhizobium sp. SYSU BS000235]|uniref:hypothetical protein n=1 Tax=Bradyrhizobium sp. SYSU BS000235 TaxID=3411332 RepID=UPI003C749755